MSDLVSMTLEEVIRDSGEGWLIDYFEPPSDAVSHIRALLISVGQEAEKRFPANPPDISEEAIIQAYHSNPQMVRGLFQAIGNTNSPAMLLMTWRIMQGMNIDEVKLTYQLRRSFEFEVIVKSPYGEIDPPYHSTEIRDFSLLRHFGIMQISGKPAFDGFYPFNML